MSVPGSDPRSERSNGTVWSWASEAVALFSPVVFLPCWKPPGRRPRPSPTCFLRSPRGRTVRSFLSQTFWRTELMRQTWEVNFNHNFTAPETLRAADKSTSSQSFQNKSSASTIACFDGLFWSCFCGIRLILNELIVTGHNIVCMSSGCLKIR